MGRTRKKIISAEFDKKIYKAKAVKKAVEDYKDVAKITLEESKGFYKVEFRDVSKELKDIVVDEFGNYVLALNRDF